MEKLWRQVLRDFPLRFDSIHGPVHWARVERNGLYLAEQLGLDGKLISHFALFHDCRRRREFSDEDHGRRGADYIDQISDELADLSPAELVLLKQACADHTSQRTTEIPLLAVCWDADRLDLGRVGTRPDIHYLNTEPARCLVNDDQLDLLHELPCRSLSFLRGYENEG